MLHYDDSEYHHKNEQFNSRDYKYLGKLFHIRKNTMRVNFLEKVLQINKIDFFKDDSFPIWP